VREALKEAMDLFGLDNPVENARFRDFDGIMRVKLRVYGNLDVTLEDCNIWNGQLLALELKPEGGEFEEYNPDFVYLRIALFDPSKVPYDFTKINDYME